MRNVLIDISYRGLCVRGTEGWADPGHSWMVAHDVLHHLPTDEGTVEQEIATFGAESWSTCSQVLEGNARSQYEEFIADNPGHLVLAPAPFCVWNRKTKQFLESFRTELPVILEEAAEAFGRKFEGAEVAEQENVQRHQNWLAYGYQMAQSRFPNKAKARQLFTHLERALQPFALQTHYVGRTLALALDEAGYTFKLELQPVDLAADLA